MKPLVKDPSQSKTQKNLLWKTLFRARPSRTVKPLVKNLLRARPNETSNERSWSEQDLEKPLVKDPAQSKTQKKKKKLVKDPAQSKTQ